MNQKPDPDKLTRVLTESAHQIWSAGLGALSQAEKEGSKLFESLSKLGENIQSHTRSTADVAKQTVSGSRAAATETWDKLEQMFELRVARALNGLQIPTAKDIKELSKRVDKLSRAVDELSAKKTKGKTTAKKKRKKTKKKDEKKKRAKRKKKKAKSAKKKG
ncbi:MAG: phasin family protein [Gammaproteobacteria bacterium]|nr:phasin family protein [Gammaproteobacteria bacterium]